MKRKPRRRVAANQDESIDSTSSSPGKEKENFSPSSRKGRGSIETHNHQFNTLLKDFDQNVVMTKKDIITNLQMMVENLTLPFTMFLMKLPTNIKNMKWADYMKMKAIPKQETPNEIPELKLTTVKTTVPKSNPSSVLSKLETPALRSSSRLKKLPVITPKFDPTTPAGLINKRQARPGEMLLSLKGSPVSIPNPTPFLGRSVTYSAASEDKDMLVALLKNPETMKSALKDKDFLKIFNSVGKLLKE